MENTLSVNEFYNYLVKNKFFSETKSEIRRPQSQNSTISINAYCLKNGLDLKRMGSTSRGKNVNSNKTKEDQAWEKVKPKYYSMVDLCHKNKYKTAAEFTVDALKLIVGALSSGVHGALIVLLEYLYKFIDKN